MGISIERRLPLQADYMRVSIERRSLIISISEDVYWETIAHWGCLLGDSHSLQVLLSAKLQLCVCMQMLYCIHVECTKGVRYTSFSPPHRLNSSPRRERAYLHTLLIILYVNAIYKVHYMARLFMERSGSWPSSLLSSSSLSETLIYIVVFVCECFWHLDD